MNNIALHVLGVVSFVFVVMLQFCAVADHMVRKGYLTWEKFFHDGYLIFIAAVTSISLTLGCVHFGSWVGSQVGTWMARFIEANPGLSIIT